MASESHIEPVDMNVKKHFPITLLTHIKENEVSIGGKKVLPFSIVTSSIGEKTMAEMSVIKNLADKNY